MKKYRKRGEYEAMKYDGHNKEYILDWINSECVGDDKLATEGKNNRICVKLVDYYGTFYGQYESIEPNTTYLVKRIGKKGVYPFTIKDFEETFEEIK